MAQSNLRKILAREGKTHAQLASASGVSVGTVSKIVNGKRTATPRTNHKILKGLNGISGKNYQYQDLFPNSKEY